MTSEEPVAFLVPVRVRLDHGSPETYQLALSFALGERAEDLRRHHPEAVLCELSSAEGEGVLIDAVYDPGLRTGGATGPGSAVGS